MTPDPETEANIVQKMANVLAAQFDHVSYDGDGLLLVVEEGYHFTLTVAVLDNGEPVGVECDGAGL